MILLPFCQPLSNSAESELAANNRASEIAVKCRLGVKPADMNSLSDDVRYQHINDVRAVGSDSCVTAKNQAALLVQQQTAAVRRKIGEASLALLPPEELQEVFGGNVSVDCIRHCVNLVLDGAMVGLNGYAADQISEWCDLPLVPNGRGGIGEKIDGMESIVGTLVSSFENNQDHLAAFEIPRSLFSDVLLTVTNPIFLFFFGLFCFTFFLILRLFSSAQAPAGKSGPPVNSRRVSQASAERQCRQCQGECRQIISPSQREQGSWRVVGACGFWRLCWKTLLSI
jgi:hypothetical protein